ncbi:MAG: class I SAM-dependent methyltransferase [Pseudomonadota bacterium]
MVEVRSPNLWLDVLAGGALGAGESYMKGNWTSPDLVAVVRVFCANLDTLQALDKPDLQPGDHLLEIGTGWGGLAVHAAKHYGCRVTTTISRAQHAVAVQRARDAGVADRIRFLFDDYRDLTGSYDKLVSIEMIEAVGEQYMDTYFATLSSLLMPDGLALVQAITIADQRYDSALASVDFIQRYIFPGGFLPSVAAIANRVARRTDLGIVHYEDIGLHYARTLQHRRERFFASLPQVRAQGYDDTFVRIWDYSLCYCEGGFRERVIGTGQVLMAKPGRLALPSMA